MFYLTMLYLRHIDTLNTFCLRLYGVRHIVKEEGRKEMLYLMTHSTHVVYGYMASDIW